MVNGQVYKYIYICYAVAVNGVVLLWFLNSNPFLFFVLFLKTNKHTRNQ